MDKKDKIVVVDSGVGGLDILNYLKDYLPNEDFYYIADNKNVPYGTKSVEEIQQFGADLGLMAQDLGAKMIVIACNTLTINSAKMHEVVDIPICGIVQPTAHGAAKLGYDSVLVLATQASVNSGKYVEYLKEINPDMEVYQQAGPKLVEYIEGNRIDEIDEVIKEYMEPYKDKVEAVVLGCTHFPIVMDRFKALYPNIEPISSREFIKDYVIEQLDAQGLKNDSGKAGEIYLTATGSIDNLKKASEHFFDYSDVIIEK